MQGRPAHLRRRARVRGLAPDFVCNMTKQRTKSNKSLWVLLGGALLLRLVLALVTDGYPYDMSCFVAWGDKLAAEGPAAFYSEGYFADYPPGYLWVLGLVGAIRAALHIAYESKWTYFLLALVPSLCDCGLAWLVYRAAKRSSRGVKEHTALVLTAFTAFNPLMLFDTGVWKQIDGAFALPLVLCFVLLEQRRYLPAAVLYGVALAIKPQALLFGPVLAVCYLAAITLEKDLIRNGQPFRQHGIDESYPEGLSPEDTVRYIAKKKCDAAAALCAPDDLIITADTMVFLGNDRLGKPHDEDDAFRMLRELAGRGHTVCTGVSVRRGETSELFAVSTRVFFRPATDDEIRAYIKTGEPMDKAGAYGVQSRGALFVERIDGDFFNVMGLPVEQLGLVLARFGVKLL